MNVPKSAIIDLYACLHECLDILIDHTAAVPFSVLTQELDGFARPNVRDQIAHVFSVETAWVAGLQLLPIRRIDPGTLTSIDEIRRAKKDVMAATVVYLECLSDDQLNRELERYPPEWMGPHRTPAFTLLHVITHGFHHKGQIVAMLRLLGYPAPDTDMQRGD
jgi:uncharacterized damage-inducible protein DinB